MREGSPIHRPRCAGLQQALLRLDRAGLETAVARHPRLVLNISRLVSERMRTAVRGSVDFHLAPPLQRIGLLDWNAFDKVVEIGYRYAVDALGPAAVARLTGSAT